jgi:glycosyltransferase involved in cell wall biosynthesis
VNNDTAGSPGDNSEKKTGEQKPRPRKKQPFENRTNPSYEKSQKPKEANSSKPEANTQKRNPSGRKPQPRRQQNTNLISIVVPVYNEEESLPELALQIEKELEKSRDKYEVIFIDDGSTDDSFNQMKAINRRNKRFKAIQFRRNNGKSAALAVGFKEARGNIVITMDADLQDDPAEIVNLVKKLREGYDLVSGWKKNRKDPISKTIPSKLANFMMNKFSGLKLHDHNCGLKAYKKEVVKTVKVYGEMHRYIPILANAEGFKCTEIPVKHHARRYGKSKYGMSRLIKGYLDFLTVIFTTRYFKRPLHFFGTIGSILASAGFLINLYLTILWFMSKTDLTNRPLMTFGIALIIVGVQFLSMGLIGEMIVKNTSDTTNYSISNRI